jgi:hypothetical protein
LHKIASGNSELIVFLKFKYKSLSNSFFQESKFIFLCCKILSPSAEGSRGKENPPRLPSAVVVKKPTPSAFGSCGEETHPVCLRQLW